MSEPVAAPNLLCVSIFEITPGGCVLKDRTRTPTRVPTPVAHIVREATTFCTCSRDITAWCARALLQGRDARMMPQMLRREAKRRGETDLLQDCRATELVNVLGGRAQSRRADLVAWLAEESA